MCIFVDTHTYFFCFYDVPCSPTSRHCLLDGTLQPMSGTNGIIYQWNYLSIYQCIYQWNYLSVYRSINQSKKYVSIYLSIIYLSMELSINYVPSGKVLSCALQYVAGSRICIERDVQGSFAKSRTMPGGVNDIKYSATDGWHQWNYLSMKYL